MSEDVWHRLLLQDGDLISHHYQDAQDIFDRNKAAQADPIRHEWGRPVAEIPAAVALQWYNEEVAKDPTFKMTGKRWNDFCLKKLRDRDWLFLNSQPGSSNKIGWRK